MVSEGPTNITCRKVKIREGGGMSSANVKSGSRIFGRENNVTTKLAPPTETYLRHQQDQRRHHQVDSELILKEPKGGERE
jgi:hypothetical protein